MSLEEMKLNDFAEAVADKVSVPGGGGASAYVGALAAALGSMTAVFTAGVPKYADVDLEMRELLSELEELRNQLVLCIQKDADGFEPLSKAYKLDKDFPNRNEIMEKCLLDAASVPFEVVKLCSRVINISDILAKKGSTLMLSDAGCSAVFAKAALKGAALNVFINTKLMNDRNTADKMNEDLEKIYEASVSKSDEVYEYVMGNLK